METKRNELEMDICVKCGREFLVDYDNCLYVNDKGYCSHCRDKWLKFNSETDEYEEVEEYIGKGRLLPYIVELNAIQEHLKVPNALLYCFDTTKLKDDIVEECNYSEGEMLDIELIIEDLETAYENLNGAIDELKEWLLIAHNNDSKGE